MSVPSQPATPAADAQRVFGELKNAINVLSTVAGSLGIDLVFKTAPVETEGAHLTFDGCERCNPIVSQGGEHRFYRGKYHVTAALNGYAPYEGWLDLVDDSKTTLECDMVRTRQAANGRGSSCSLRAQ